MTAKKRQKLPAAASSAKRRSRVVAIPRFEDHGDRICEWLSALNAEAPSRRRIVRVIREMREVETDALRVRNSARHENLAIFLGHAAHSLECAEIPGARYILMMAHALLSARAAKEGNCAEPGIVLQLPGRSAAVNESTAGGAATEIVAG
ncbi:MAG TPA: hypothetical protein VFT60_15365 [Bryobacteraceae bacterium]|nr:hypothetical protein [Bryobacteraceae bacterium]